MPAPAVTALRHTAPRKPHSESAKAADSNDQQASSRNNGLTNQIRIEEARAEQARHRLAAAQDRIVELQRTVQEQEQLLASAAAEAIAHDMRAAAPGVTRVSHQTPVASRATSAQAGSDGEEGAPYYAAGGGAAALLAALLFMRRRRRGVVDMEAGYPSLGPSLQPAR
jgi:LPXTG-motif cell wall-anchored protein